MSRGKVSIKWIDAMQFVGTDSGNHSVVISSHDKENHSGVRPSDLLLLALGSCSAYDVVKILEKKKVGLSNLDIEIQSEQAPDPPYAFKKINIHYVVSGKSISEKSVEQAIQLSLEKYCSVAATLRGVEDIQ
jgi:putative redox protein